MFTGVTDAMRILQEEISEPMVTVTSFDTYEETIALVNESKYSTTCGIMNGDMNEFQASRQIDAGITYVNNYYRNPLDTPSQAPSTIGTVASIVIETLHTAGPNYLHTLWN